jgi:hypothetical protein
MKTPPFSRRTAWDLSDNDLSLRVAETRATGASIIDLTESNPTRAGLAPSDEVVALLGHPRGAVYAPEPLGALEAREAVARYYADRGVQVDPARVALSASSSEAYGWLFKLLCDRGDEVLVPAPSYPLLDYLAGLEEVSLVRYPLQREVGFRIDFEELERRITERTRAIVIVSPNNPTGTFTRRDEAVRLEQIAADHGLALIVDEVFGDYAFEGLAPDRLPTFVGNRGALTFVLSGLSKVCLLPQMKLGWTVACGAHAAAAMARLEVIADTYLSVATPVQRALPEILAARAPLQDAIRCRTRDNLAALDRAIGPDSPITRLPSDAGWYAMIEVPRTRDDDGWIELLLREERVIVHPGYFFDTPRDGFLVVSLLPESDVFKDAIVRVVACIERAC